MAVSIVGTVTRTNSGSTPYLAMYADKTSGGMHATATIAQQAIANSYGGRFVRWTQEDMPGNIEHWVGRVGS